MSSVHAGFGLKGDKNKVSLRTYQVVELLQIIGELWVINKG